MSLPNYFRPTDSRHYLPCEPDAPPLPPRLKSPNPEEEDLEEEDCEEEDFRVALLPLLPEVPSWKAARRMPAISSTLALSSE